METYELEKLLRTAQAHISQYYAASLTGPDKREQLLEYIRKFLRDTGSVPAGETEETVSRLYDEMAEYSLLTGYLRDPCVEEININSWDDIAVTYRDGRTEKCAERFFSPEHALDIVRRLLGKSGAVLDNSSPVAEGHLPGNTRVTALKTPVVDPDRGVCASIRILRPSDVDVEEVEKSGCASAEMVSFLCACLRYGVSFVIAGATSSGKTTLLNAVLSTLPDTKRVFTIESGSRELSLVRRDVFGNVTNNAVHTLSRPSDIPSGDISQEDLVAASLRFDPDIIVVGEMRDTEACAAVEASLTGHTVVSTIHSYAGPSAHTRLALLCQKRFPLDFEVSVSQAASAFPVVVYAHRTPDNARRVTDISECVTDGSGKRTYVRLFTYVPGSPGHFERVGSLSPELAGRMERAGAPKELTDLFTTPVKQKKAPAKKPSSKSAAKPAEKPPESAEKGDEK